MCTANLSWQYCRQAGDTAQEPPRLRGRGGEGALASSILWRRTARAWPGRRGQDRGQDRRVVTPFRFRISTSPLLLPLRVSIIILVVFGLFFFLFPSLRVKHHHLPHVQRQDKGMISDTAPSDTHQIQTITDSESHCLWASLRSSVQVSDANLRTSQSLKPKHVGELREVKRSIRHFAYAFPASMPAASDLGIVLLSPSSRSVCSRQFLVTQFCFCWSAPNLCLGSVSSKLN